MEAEDMARITPITEPACAICLLEANELATPLRTTACGHSFCEQCLSGYVFSKPINAPTPCPMCRQTLVQADLPTHFTVDLTCGINGALGVTLSKAVGLTPTRIASVQPGGAAAAAGLRPSMLLLAINDIGILPGETSAQVCERIRTHSGASVKLRIEWERRAATAVATTTAAATQELEPSVTAGLLDNSFFCFCCCCCHAGQLWQRVMSKPKWHCKAIATILYLLAACWLLSDVVQIAEGWSSSGHVFYLGANSTAGQFSNSVMSMSFFPWWLGMAYVTYRVRARLQRDEPHIYERLPEDMRRPLDPCLACCCVLQRLLAILSPADYHPFMVLPVVDRPAGRAGGDVELAAVAPVAPPTTGGGMSPPASPPLGSPQSITPLAQRERPIARRVMDCDVSCL